MSTYNNLHNVRKNGRFVKKKELARVLKIKETKEKKVAEKRQRLISATLAPSPEDEFDPDQADANHFAKSVMDGRRIIDIGILWKEMFCSVCRRGLCFRDVVKERSRGLACVWTMRCPYCLLEKDVHTSSTYVSVNSGCSRYTVNAKLIFGMNDCGIGPAKINSLWSALNIPQVDPSTLKRAEDDVGPAVAAVAEVSCMQGLLTEKEMTLKSPLSMMNVSSVGIPMAL